VSNDALNPHQLQMFMRPSELLGKVKGVVDADRGQSVADVMEYKHRNAQYQADYDRMETHPHEPTMTLDESIRSEGIRKPVILSPGDTVSTALDSTPNRSEHFWLGNGHHRVATAAAMEKEGTDIHVPVIYDHNYMGSKQTRDTFGVAD